MPFFLPEPVLCAVQASGELFSHLRFQFSPISAYDLLWIYDRWLGTVTASCAPLLPASGWIRYKYAPWLGFCTSYPIHDHVVTCILPFSHPLLHCCSRDGQLSETTILLQMPPKDNAGHSLQAEFEGSHSVQCQYQDTDCFYDGMGREVCLVALSPHTELQPTPSLFICCVVMKHKLLVGMSFPADVCPTALADNVCSDPIVAPQPKLLDTVCPFSNGDFINVPLRNQPTNPSYIQCHYSTSECFYDVCFLPSDDRTYL